MHTTTNGFNLQIINPLMGSWGVRLTWLDYKLHKLAFTSKLLCFPTVLRLVPFIALNVFGYFSLMRAFILSKRKNLFLINSAQLTTFPNLWNGMGRERNQTVFFLNVGLCSYVTEGLFDRLKKCNKHFVHMEPLNFSLSLLSQLFLSNRQLGLDFSDH